MSDYQGKFSGEEIDELLGKIPELESRIGSSSGGDKNFVFTQSNPSSVWEITHNLGKYPSVTVVEYYSNQEIVAEVQYESLSKVKITFSENLKGKAYLN